MMIAFLLLACGSSSSQQSQNIETSGFWNASNERFQAYRVLDAGANPAKDTGFLNENLLLNQYQEAAGCDGAGWRVEFRQGSTWNNADSAGALHFFDANGLAICAYEDEEGNEVSVDGTVVLWDDQPLGDGQTIDSNAWSVTATQEEDVVTYYGVFPSATAFAIEGSGGTPSGWTLWFADEAGLILIENDDFTADLVYYR